MIQKNVIENLSNLNESFSNAEPFKHIIIDDFLEETAINKLCKDFPPFDKSKAINENGDIGPKCVHTDIASISSFYEKFDKHIRSRAFIDHIEDITGIKDLVIDRRMYGGGTHENVDGAELDVHVDFNYDTETNYHRRLNLLLYLNEDWDEEWGGAIEIISNPLNFYKKNMISKSYNCIKNRCLIFETNEYSWHGFKKIKMPQNIVNSRKLISIYFYTKDRPESEIVANHGTFYFPYPPELKNSLTYDEDIRLIQKRDELLFSSYKKEIEQSKKILQLENRIADLEKNVKPHYEGFINLLSISGYFSDGWITNNFSAKFSNSRKIKRINIDIMNPQEKKGDVLVKLNDKQFTFDIYKKNHKLELKDVSLSSSQIHKFDIVSDINSSVELDQRQLSLVLNKLVFE